MDDRLSTEGSVVRQKCLRRVFDRQMSDRQMFDP